MHRLMEALCPMCGAQLDKVRNPAGSMLNDDQFDSVKAGDWHCTSCTNDRGRTGAYFWDKEVKHCLPEGMYVGVKHGDGKIRVAQITAEDTEEMDTEVVLYPSGATGKLQHSEMLIPPNAPGKEVEQMLAYLFSCVAADVKHLEELKEKFTSAVEKRREELDAKLQQARHCGGNHFDIDMEMAWLAGFRTEFLGEHSAGTHA